MAQKQLVPLTRSWLPALALLTAAAAAQERGVIRPAPLPSAGPQRRMALVIANGAYAWGPLRNTLNDGRGMTAALRALKFDVDPVENAGRAAMLQGVRNFVSKLREGDVAVFYFAGHGVQVHGENYLIPTDLNPQTVDDVEDNALSANKVLRQLESSGARMRILILDACRDNPLRPSRSAARGLARMEAGAGTYIAFAAAEGQSADDNPRGLNGLFTGYLLTALGKPGLSLEQVFIDVRHNVMQASGGAQVPASSDYLVEEFYFRPAAGSQPAATAFAETNDIRTMLSGYGKTARSPRARMVADDEEAFQQIAAGLPAYPEPGSVEDKYRRGVLEAIELYRRGDYAGAWGAAQAAGGNAGNGWESDFVSGLALTSLHLSQRALGALKAALENAPEQEFDRIRAAMSRARTSLNEAVRNGWLWTFHFDIGTLTNFLDDQFVLLPGGICHGTVAFANLSGRRERSCEWSQSGTVLTVSQSYSDGKAHRYTFNGSGPNRTGAMEDGSRARAEQFLPRDANVAAAYQSALAKARAWMQQGRTAQALGQSSLAERNDSSGWEAHAISGTALAELHLYEDALSELEEAAVSAPDEDFNAIRDAFLAARQARDAAIARGELRLMTNGDLGSEVMRSNGLALLPDGSCHMTSFLQWGDGRSVGAYETACFWTRSPDSFRLTQDLQPDGLAPVTLVFDLKRTDKKMAGTWSGAETRGGPAQLAAAAAVMRSIIRKEEADKARGKK